MSYRDENQPSMGAQGWGHRRIGIVVDIKDPEELGRFKVRFLDQGPNAPSDEQLPWIHVGMNNMPSVRGVGFFPAMYLTGSRVVCDVNPDGSYTVSHSLPNSDKSEQKTDTHEDGKPAIGQQYRDVFGNKEKFEELMKNSSTTRGLQIANGKPEDWKKSEKDTANKENVDDAPTPTNYKNRTAAKTAKGELPTVGSELFSEFRNAQKYIKDLIGNKGSFIPQALDMLENLKKVNSLSVPFPTNVVGPQNLLQAMQGLSALLKKQSGGQQQLEIPTYTEVQPTIFASLDKTEFSDTSTSEVEIV